MLSNNEYSRLMMVHYALKFYDLIKQKDYLIVSSEEEVINLLWDCQNDLMLFDSKAPELGVLEYNKLKSDKSLRVAYSNQLLNILKVGVVNREFGFEMIKAEDLDRVVIV